MFKKIVDCIAFTNIWKFSPMKNNMKNSKQTHPRGDRRVTPACPACRQVGGGLMYSISKK